MMRFAVLILKDVAIVLAHKNYVQNQFINKNLDIKMNNIDNIN